MRFNSHNRVFGLDRLLWNKLQWVWIAAAFIWLCTVVPGFAEDLNYMSPSYDNLFSDYRLGSKPSDSFSIYKESYGSAGPMVLNYQSGLLEQVVLVVNNTTTNWSAVKLLVSNVKGGIVYNASVVNNGYYELIHNYIVPANGGMVKFVVEYKTDFPDESEELEEEPHFAFPPGPAERQNEVPPPALHGSARNTSRTPRSAQRSRFRFRPPGYPAGFPDNSAVRPCFAPLSDCHSLFLMIECPRFPVKYTIIGGAP